MQRGWAENDGMSDQTIGYYLDRVNGGMGLLISEGVIIDHDAGYVDIGEMHMRPDTYDGWARLGEVIKGAGGHFLLQLWHPGAVRMDGQGRYPDIAPISPSGIFNGEPRGRAITEQDLEDLTAGWVAGAVAAQEAGLDGVEIHMAHGYLLHQFLWHEMNRRTDGLGGDGMADRLKFPLRVLQAVRAAVKPDFIISCRVSQWAEWDYDAKIARTPEELETLIRALDAGGADMLHMSTRYFHNPEWPDLHPTRTLSGWVKEFTDLPVVTVGSVGMNVDLMQTLYSDRDELQTIESSVAELLPLFEDGQFDLVAVGRASIGDPELVTKIRDGRFDEIRPFTRADIFDIAGDLDDHGVPEEILKLAQQAADSGD